MDRLRNRDLRTNNNKCYTMYFDDDQNKDITNKASMPAKKGKSRSPRKKEPIKNVTVNQPLNDSLNDGGDSKAIDIEQQIASSVVTQDGKKIAVTTTVTSDANAVKSDKEDIALDFSHTKSGNDNDGNEQNAIDECTKSVNGTSLTKKNESTSDDNQSKTDTKTNKQLPAELKNGQQNENERKRRLSQSCSDRNDEADDDFDDDAESNGTESTVYSGKKPKMEFSKAKMFQVGYFFQSFLTINRIANCILYRIHQFLHFN